MESPRKKAQTRWGDLEKEPSIKRRYRGSRAGKIERRKCVKKNGSMATARTKTPGEGGRGSTGKRAKEIKQGGHLIRRVKMENPSPQILRKKTPPEAENSSKKGCLKTGPLYRRGRSVPNELSKSSSSD